MIEPGENTKQKESDDDDSIVAFSAPAEALKKIKLEQLPQYLIEEYNEGNEDDKKES